MYSQVDKKHRVVRQFEWADDGHRLNVYLNCYMNVAVREDKFKDYIAAGLETLAAELRQDAAKARGKYLQAQCEMATPERLPDDEVREQSKLERQAEREAAKDS